jgi:polysaccharide deacetylase family protein (PEP-CTERM system associated)
MDKPLSAGQKQHLLTVELEDYYHVGAFHQIILPEHWYRFEKRIERNTHKALALLDRFGIKATFFVLGWVADKMPEIVREVAERGHEVGSKGYHHQAVHQLTPSQLREDLSRAREALESASGRKVLGYRVAHRWLDPSDLWVLDVLAEEGYSYDSSLGFVFRRFASQPWRRFLHLHKYGNKRLWEIPPSSSNLMGLSMPISGGNYYRQFPHTLVKHAVEHWHRNYDAPFVMYFHIWELDPDQPKINTGSFLANIRHYRNLNKMSWVLKDYFTKYQFVGIAEYLGLETTLSFAPESPRRPEEGITPQLHTLNTQNGEAESHDNVAVRDEALGCRKPVSIVVPCYNEENNLQYLANTLESVQAQLQKEYDLHFILVDDFSADGTWAELQKIFGAKPNHSVYRHVQNLGVAAAILTGIRHAKSEIVCSIDCDCTYDPHELQFMIPLLADGVELVTASPYHPLGKVRNVPPWRLTLSKAASFLYRIVLKQKISTYTSCFRVYRKSTIVKLNLKEPRFLGLAELIGVLDLHGGKIVEYPTTLESRLLGQSSMKVLRTIRGHLGLIVRLFFLRITAAGGRASLNDKDKLSPNGPKDVERDSQQSPEEIMVKSLAGHSPISHP